MDTVRHNLSIRMSNGTDTRASFYSPVAEGYWRHIPDAMKATDRHKLIDRIKTIEGLTDDERSALLGFLRGSKTYGLVWEDKPEEVEERLRSELPVLVEVKDRALTDAGPDAPNHILIEGDNLEALTTLAYTHAGKIDVIYIDPPYNTGNKDFIYNDSYVDSEDTYRHSKWLSFMSHRLKIAKKLLSDHGVIFISIDDNEQASLKLLCDDIFGQQNFIANVIWEKKYTVANDAKYFSDNHDFIICFAKNKPNFKIGELPRTDEMNAAYKNPDNHPKGPWKATPLHARSGSDTSFSYTFRNGVTFRPPSGRFSAYSAETLRQFDENNEIWFGTKGNSTPSRKTFLCDLKKQGVVPRTIISFSMGGHNHEADEEVKEIFNAKIFTSPKPTRLLKLLISIANFNNGVILDFFAGSGTTLHAVMQLNAEDGGKRQCILCTNNENGICENVTYERNKRVIEGYTKPNGEKVEGLHDNNLRYYRTDFVSRDRTTKNMRRLVQLSTDMLCIKENLYAEKKSFAGMPTYKNIYRFFEHGERKMLVIYDERYVDEIVKMIASVETGSKIKVYLFSPSEDPWEASFEPVIDKVELCALPQAIYNTYKRILPKRTVGTRHGASAKHTGEYTTDEEIGGLFAAEPKGGDE